MERQYPSDVSDEEWSLLEPFFVDHQAPRKRGRPQSAQSARRSLNAIRYLLKTGCQWRMLPKEYPSRTTAHDALSRWTRSGLWERINTMLRERKRSALKKTPAPARRSSTVRV